MKANRITNRTRILTTIGLLIFAITVGNSQGLLAVVDFEEIVEANYSRTIHIAAVERSYEAALETEGWMIQPLSESMESEIETEGWMIQPLSKSMESEIGIESWMTVSFTESTEKVLNVEDWMTQAFISE